MNHKLPTLFGFCLLGLAACAQEDLPPMPVTPPMARTAAATDVAVQKKTDAQYAYGGERYRDPFVSLAGEAVQSTGTDELVTPNVSALTLKGIFNDGKQSIAIVSAGVNSYTLKGSRLYDNRNRLIKGITGVVRKESVLLIAPDKTTKELKLRDK
jgi:hypothetical protein